VVETQRGHDLGRVYFTGSAAPNTGVPGNIGGYTLERLLRAPCAGEVEQLVPLGALVKAGDMVGKVGGTPVFTAIDGVLRGFVRPGVYIPARTKLGDVDPRGLPEYCRTVSEKARALGGAVLEACCTRNSTRQEGFLFP
jgi:xanthine dehydrogenase accessory factor